MHRVQGMRPDVVPEAAIVGASAAAELYGHLQPWSAPDLSHLPCDVAELVRKAKDIPSLPAEVRSPQPLPKHARRP